MTQESAAAAATAVVKTSEAPKPATCEAIENAKEGDVLKGRVKSYSSKNGYGFISVGSSKTEIFVHQAEIRVTGFRSLDKGQKVSFTYGLRDNKPNAFSVHPIEEVPGEDGAPWKGTVKWFDVTKGFGFITPDGEEDREKDVFVHINNVPDKVPLQDGQRVTFKIDHKEGSKNKLNAIDLTVEELLPDGFMKGTVKWFDTQKGFGFIVKDNKVTGDSDVFVHVQQSPYGEGLRDGARVVFKADKREGADGKEGRIAATEVHYEDDFMGGGGGGGDRRGGYDYPPRDFYDYGPPPPRGAYAYGRYDGPPPHRRGPPPPSDYGYGGGGGYGGGYGGGGGGRYGDDLLPPADYAGRPTTHGGMKRGPGPASGYGGYDGGYGGPAKRSRAHAYY